MSDEDRCLLLKFWTGRSRLMPGKTLNLELCALEEDYLPIAHTCSFDMEVPSFSSKEVMMQKFLTAIRLCGEIDDDDYNYGEEIANDDYGQHQGRVLQGKGQDLDVSIEDFKVNFEDRNKNDDD